MRVGLRRIRRSVTALVVVLGVFFSAPVLSAAEAANAAALVARIFSGEATPQGVSELKAMQDHLQKLAEKIVPCTVGVRVGPAQGSGVIVSKDGYVLTAAHVIGRPGQDVTLVLHDGRTVKAKSLGLNRTIDSGLIKITDEGDFPYVEMGDSRKLQEGQWCIATGHPGGYERGRTPVVRLGRVLQTQDDVVMTDCTLVGGDSGGPLFDMEGRVIGINSRIAGPLNANMHVPVSTFQDTWDRLAAAEAWGNVPGVTPFLGVQGEPETTEPRIAEVFPGTPADQGGMRVGDVILSFDGKPVDTFRALSRMVAEKSPGDRVKVVVQRGMENVKLEVVIGKRSE